MKKYLIILVSILVISSCKSRDFVQDNQKQMTDPEAFSFYVAGHTYGSHSKASTKRQDFLHPPFIKQLSTIAQDDSLAFGVLTGDTVYFASDTSFQNLIATMAETKKPYYIAPGNHELDNDGIYFDKYFAERNHLFLLENNLFIILSPIEDWSIADEQLLMIEEAIACNPEVNNIFVLTHYLIWAEQIPKNTDFEDFQPNGWENKTGESNFWSEVFPLFDSYKGDVWFIAGDIGAYKGKPGFVEKHIGQSHFIASGMGNYTTDNYLKFSVSEDGGVELTVNSLVNFWDIIQILPRDIMYNLRRLKYIIENYQNFK